MSLSSYDYLFKVTLVGDSGVGKSCTLLQYTDKRFQTTHDLTIGVEFAATIETVFFNKCKLQIWDTAGQETFRTITRSYYRDSKAVIIFFDITTRITFSHTESWYYDTQKQAGNNCVFILVGNKSDLEHQRQVTFEEAQKFAKSLGMPYWEISAKNAQNVNELFQNITTQIFMNSEHAFQSLFYKNNNILQYKVQNEALVNSFNTLNSSNIKNKNKLWMETQQKLTEELIRYKVRLILNLDRNVFNDNQRSNNICTFISKISPYLIEFDTFNYEYESIFVALLTNAKIRKCSIRAHYDDCVADYRLYGDILHNIYELRLEINDKLFKAFNDNKNDIWNKFSHALLNNGSLKTLALCVNNKDLHDEINTKIFCKILKLIQENKNCEFKCLELLCQGNGVCTSESTMCTADNIHLSIIDCIASKTDSMERIIIKSENIANCMQNLFNGLFCAKLLNIKFKNLLELNLDLCQSVWDSDNILCLSQFISQTTTLRELVINSKLILKSSDQNKNEKVIGVLVYSIHCSSLKKIMISCFNNIAVKHGLNSFVKLIKSSKASKIKLSFDDLCINDELYKLLDSWVYCIQQNYNYYKIIKQYIDDDNTLPMFDQEIKTEIFEYIKLETNILIIDVPIYNKQFLVMSYLIDKLTEMMKKENLITENDKQISQQTAYTYIIDALYKMIQSFIFIPKENLEGCNVFIEDQPLIIENINDYNHLKWDFLSNVDHSALCFGYIHQISEYFNILIPSPIYYIIWQFYPEYKVYEINPDDVDQTYSLQIYKHLSAICDSTDIILYKLYDTDSLLYKPMIHNGIWYEIDKDQTVKICQQLNMKSKSEEYNILPNDNTYIDIISCPYNGWMRAEKSLLFVVGNKGDVLLLENTKQLFLSSQFLLKNNNRIISIQSSVNHALFLTSNGNVFSYGLNDCGQCGFKNKDIKHDINKELHKIKQPYLLKKLSEYCIKSIYVGANFSFCIDKNNNLYCFGSNLFNKLGLNNNKCEINIIWEPMKSDFFNSKNGIIVKQIQCATNLVVFVDNNGQCYWSGKHFVEIYSVNLNIFHWQKWKNEYNNVKIVQALCADEENDEKALVVMVDSKHKLKVELIGTIESMPYVQIDGLDENTIIDNLLFSLGGIMIVTSKRK